MECSGLVARSFFGRSVARKCRGSQRANLGGVLWGVFPRFLLRHGVRLPFDDGGSIWLAKGVKAGGVPSSVFVWNVHYAVVDCHGTVAVWRSLVFHLSTGSFYGNEGKLQGFSVCERDHLHRLGIVDSWHVT